MNIKNKTYTKLSNNLNYRASIQKAMMSDNLTILLKIETTDVNPMVDEVIRINAMKVRFEDYKLIEIDRFDEFINPKAETIDDYVLNKNNITIDELKASRNIIDVMQDFYTFCGETINLIGYNIDRFVLPFLKNAGFNSGEMIDIENKVDVMAMAISLLEPNKNICNYKLNTILNYLDIEEETDIDNLFTLFNELFSLVPKGIAKAKVLNSKHWKKSNNCEYIFFYTDYGEIGLNCNTCYFKEKTPGIFDVIDIDSLIGYICEKGNTKTINDFVKMYLKTYVK